MITAGQLVRAIGYVQNRFMNELYEPQRINSVANWLSEIYLKFDKLPSTAVIADTSIENFFGGYAQKFTLVKTKQAQIAVRLCNAIHSYKSTDTLTLEQRAEKNIALYLEMLQRQEEQEAAEQKKAAAPTAETAAARQQEKEKLEKQLHEQEEKNKQLEREKAETAAALKLAQTTVSEQNSTIESLRADLSAATEKAAELQRKQGKILNELRNIVGNPEITDSSTKELLELLNYYDTQMGLAIKLADDHKAALDAILKLILLRDKKSKSQAEVGREYYRVFGSLPEKLDKIEDQLKKDMNFLKSEATKNKLKFDEKIVREQVVNKHIGTIRFTAATSQTLREFKDSLAQGGEQILKELRTNKDRLLELLTQTPAPAVSKFSSTASSSAAAAAASEKSEETYVTQDIDDMPTIIKRQAAMITNMHFSLDQKEIMLADMLETIAKLEAQVSEITARNAPTITHIPTAPAAPAAAPEAPTAPEAPAAPDAPTTATDGVNPSSSTTTTVDLLSALSGDPKSRLKKSPSPSDGKSTNMSSVLSVLGSDPMSRLRKTAGLPSTKASATSATSATPTTVDVNKELALKVKNGTAALASAKDRRERTAIAPPRLNLKLCEVVASYEKINIDSISKFTYQISKNHNHNNEWTLQLYIPRDLLPTGKDQPNQSNPVLIKMDEIADLVTELNEVKRKELNAISPAELWNAKKLIEKYHAGLIDSKKLVLNTEAISQAPSTARIDIFGILAQMKTVQNRREMEMQSKIEEKGDDTTEHSVSVRSPRPGSSDGDDGESWPTK